MAVTRDRRNAVRSMARELALPLDTILSPVEVVQSWV
jgi:hypothetical protein